MPIERTLARATPTATENDELRLVVTHPAENPVYALAATKIGSW